nr:ribose-phosphate pyrophosphokinase [Cerasicoccus sp. TK19100]
MTDILDFENTGMKEQELKIFTGNANPKLAEEICQYLGCRLGKAIVTTFPDGETFVRIDENIRGRDIFLVQPTCGPANHHLMELLIMIDAARRASASRITAVLPFFGYARQDRKDQPRVPITAKLVANLIAAAGATRVLAMDLHAQQIQGFFDIPVDHLYASPVFSNYLQQLKLESDLVVYSPDVGGMKMAAAYAEILNAPLGFVAKKRMSATDVEAFNLVGDVDGKDVLLIDDMTETAGTLTAAAKLLKKNGANSVRAAVTHGVLNDIGYERLKSGILDELITTNTTPIEPRDLPITVLSVAELLGKAIMHIHSNESVTSLFEIKGF